MKQSWKCLRLCASRLVNKESNKKKKSPTDGALFLREGLPTACLARRAFFLALPQKESKSAVRAGRPLRYPLHPPGSRTPSHEQANDEPSFSLWENGAKRCIKQTSSSFLLSINKERNPEGSSLKEHSSFTCRKIEGDC
jgi:hypothetical protein